MVYVDMEFTTSYPLTTSTHFSSSSSSILTFMSTPLPPPLDN